MCAGTVFFDNRGNVWGQPTFYSARMLTESHQPLVLNVSIEYNASMRPPAPPPPAALRSFSATVGGQQLWLRHCELDLFGTPVPSKFWQRDPAMDNSDSSFFVNPCGDGLFWLSPKAAPSVRLAPLPHKPGEPARLHGMNGPADCKPGRPDHDVWQRVNGSDGGFALKSLSPGHENTFLTLIDDGCTCPSKSGACNFSAAGDVCRSAVLAPRGATGQQTWHEASANVGKCSVARKPCPSHPGKTFCPADADKKQCSEGSDPVPAPFAAPFALDAHASRSHDGKAVSVRVVNPTNASIEAAVALDGVGGHIFRSVKGQLLTSASRMDDNSPSDPTHVSPKPISVSLLSSGVGTEPVDFPPHSFITLQFKSDDDIAKASAPAVPGFAQHANTFCSSLPDGERLFAVATHHPISTPEDCAARCSATPGCVCFDFKPHAEQGCRGVNQVKLKHSNDYTAYANCSDPARCKASPPPPPPAPPAPPGTWSQLWLDYRPVSSEYLREALSPAASYAQLECGNKTSSGVLASACAEISDGLRGMLGVAPTLVSKLTADHGIVLSAGNASTWPPNPHAEAFQIGQGRAAPECHGFDCVLISGPSEAAVLYGVFRWLGAIRREEPPLIVGYSQPASPMRMWDLWDNVDGSVERGCKKVMLSRVFVLSVSLTRRASLLQTQEKACSTGRACRP